MLFSRNHIIRLSAWCCVGLMTLFFISCGSFKNGNYARDGIYYKGNPEAPSQHPIMEKENHSAEQQDQGAMENGLNYQKYFARQSHQIKRAQNLSSTKREDTVFTDVASYSSHKGSQNPKNIIVQPQNLNYSGEYGGWGGNPANINVNYYSTGFYPGYYGFGYGYWPSSYWGRGYGYPYYNSWYSPGFYWGFGGFYGSPYYYGYGFNPYYYYGYPYYSYYNPYYYPNGGYWGVAYHSSSRNYRSSNRRKNRTQLLRNSRSSRTRATSNTRSGRNAYARGSRGTRSSHIRNPYHVNARGTRQYRQTSRIGKRVRQRRAVRKVSPTRNSGTRSRVRSHRTHFYNSSSRNSRNTRTRSPRRSTPSRRSSPTRSFHRSSTPVHTSTHHSFRGGSGGGTRSTHHSVRRR